MSSALVAIGSKHGSTMEIGAAIADELSRKGFEAAVMPAADVRDVRPYSVVVVGSGLYVGRWNGDAVSFLKRFERDLRERPTWLFSSGPTGGTPDAQRKVDEALAAPLALDPPKEVAKRAQAIGARGHATFPGSVGPGVAGIFDRWVPKGDWRDFDAIRRWADDIAEAVTH